MSVTSVLAKPLAATHQMGRFTLNRIVREDAAVLAPVVWVNVEGIVAVNYGEPTWEYEYDILQQGAGNEKTHVKRGPMWKGTITVLKGDMGDFLAAIDGVTWGTAQAVISSRMDNDNPMVHWEAVCRDANNNTHLYSLVIQDMIIDDWSFDNPMEYSDGVIPFHTYHEPFLLCTGKEMVFDKFAATPTTIVYTTSNSTPATLLSSTNHSDWDLDNAVFVKNQDDSAGDLTGKRIRSGVTFSGASLTWTTAASPAASDEISILYAKAT